MTFVLDAQAIVGFFAHEPGSSQLVPLFEAVEAGTEAGYVGTVNLAEARYILLRRDPAQADLLVQWLLDLGIALVTAEETWKEASSIKARYPISLGDSFALAAAKLKSAILVTRDDPDFDVAPSLGIEVRRIGPARAAPTKRPRK